MSQYFVYKDKKEYMMGWDRPLQYHFLTISDHSQLDEFDEPKLIFSNLDLPNPAMTIDEITKKCADFGLDLPEKIVLSLVKDKEINCGNYIERHYLDEEPSPCS